MDPEWAKRIVAESRDRIAKADVRATRMRDAFKAGTWSEYLAEVTADYGIDADITDSDIANTDIGEHAERVDDSRAATRASDRDGAELPQESRSAEPSSGGGDAGGSAADSSDEPGASTSGL